MYLISEKPENTAMHEVGNFLLRDDVADAKPRRVAPPNTSPEDFVIRLTLGRGRGQR
jgi:hypothetical protein